ncbi:MAG: carboxypeptidase-like regulatory protein, partial [Mucilaginibacter sp.]|nr:carboxypeptidase-like regulatory protein [Mucilaginibacter sp.]
MRLALACLLFFLFKTSLFAQQFTVSGKITDDAGKAVPFASIYIKNTTHGASANSDGEYSLQLKPGKYTIQYKAVGYKQESREVDASQSRVINITLNTEFYQLQTVTVGGKDPAYAIIRKAIKKRKTYLNEVKAYTCEVYIKGLQKILDAPKKFLGTDINQIARQIGLDSNRRGIIYLSESESKYSFMYPGNVHEEMISSKVSGNNRAFSFNRATDLRVNFYENFEDWGNISLRPLISPIADNALFYYNYKWLGESVENGKTVNKIQVIPRRAHDPCFEGYIYIQDDSWRLVGVNLYITKKANINIVDTIKINQQFVPV